MTSNQVTDGWNPARDEEKLQELTQSPGGVPSRWVRLMAVEILRLRRLGPVTSATPGAAAVTVRSEDSVNLKAESSRPRELLGSSVLEIERLRAALTVERETAREKVRALDKILDASSVETSRCIHDRVVCEPCAQMAVRFHEKTIALAKEISRRHTRMNKFLYGSDAAAGAVIGPSAADDAHRDRAALLSMLTPEQRGAVEPSAPVRQCGICLATKEHPYRCIGRCIDHPSHKPWIERGA